MAPHRALHHRTTLHAAMVLTVVLLLATACSGGGHASAGATSATAEPRTSAAASPAPAPVAGECHALTFAGAGQPQDATAAVPCTGPHTSQTVKVGDLAGLGVSEDTDADDVSQAVAKACPQRLLRRVGGSEVARRLSRFEVLWFTPTTKERAAGAAWFRCDVVGLAATNSLLRLPHTVARALDTATALDRFGTCGTTAPGRPGFVRVVCRRKHSWRAVSTVDLPRSTRYLGARAAALGDSDCKDVAAARANGALKYTWSFEWPTRDLWTSGQRYGYCWVPG